MTRRFFARRKRRKVLMKARSTPGTHMSVIARDARVRRAELWPVVRERRWLTRKYDNV